MADEVLRAVHQVAVSVIHAAHHGHVGPFHSPIDLFDFPFGQVRIEFPDVGVGGEHILEDRLLLHYAPAGAGAVQLEGQGFVLLVVVVFQQQVMIGVVDETEIDQGEKTVASMPGPSPSS